MRGFKSAAQVQRFLSVHGVVYNLFFRDDISFAPNISGIYVRARSPRGTPWPRRDPGQAAPRPLLVTARVDLTVPTARTNASFGHGVEPITCTRRDSSSITKIAPSLAWIEQGPPACVEYDRQNGTGSVLPEARHSSSTRAGGAVGYHRPSARQAIDLLATTTSTQDSCLLDVLVPRFESSGLLRSKSSRSAQAPRSGWRRPGTQM